MYLRMYVWPLSAASIRFEMGGSWIRVNIFSIFPGKFPKISIFFQAISQKNSHFLKENFRKISIFSGNFTKKLIIQQILVIYSRDRIKCPWTKCPGLNVQDKMFLDKKSPDKMSLDKSPRIKCPRTKCPRTKCPRTKCPRTKCPG